MEEKKSILLSHWIGRKCLEKVPTNTAHLLERFGLFFIILFGEALISTLAWIKVNLLAISNSNR